MLLIALVKKKQISGQGKVEIPGYKAAVLLHHAYGAHIGARRAIRSVPGVTQALLFFGEMQLLRQLLR